MGNLVNRTLLFVNKYYEGKIPSAPVDEELWAKVRALEEKITELEEKKSELEAKLALPEVYSNGEKAKAVQCEIEALVTQIDETTVAWEAAAEKLG